VVLGAAYMLYLYQRTMFGKVENPKNERLPDLSLREFATFVPLIVLAVWIGVYPKPFLDRLNTSVNNVIARVSPQYTNTLAANCAPAGSPGALADSARSTRSTPTAAPATLMAANNAAPFVAAAPCEAGSLAGEPPAASGEIAQSTRAGMPR
jgi:NADH-quinone oxidoreductase subunit M